MVDVILEAPRRGKPPTHLLDLPREQRKEAVLAIGQPGFRADQVARHLLVHHDIDAEHWTDIPRNVGQQLTLLLPELLSPVKSIDCDAGTTVKTVWRLHDSALVESVLMRYPQRVTVCISSQAGCGMNCPFCATGQAGLTRNLSPAEIVLQVIAAARSLDRGEVAGGPGRVSNIVFMGMGEPLANYSNVMRALRTLTQAPPDGMGISARGVTVSTVGLVPQMRQLAQEGIPVTLAVSLHCPDDELRDSLVPVNNRWKVREVLDAAWEYAAASGRRISIEYALIKDINDQQWRAHALADLLVGNLVHVNLIPLNPTPGSKWTASEKSDERAFAQTLRDRGVAVTVRDTRGREIDGACGQLAAATA